MVKEGNLPKTISTAEISRTAFSMAKGSTKTLNMNILTKELGSIASKAVKEYKKPNLPNTKGSGKTTKRMAKEHSFSTSAPNNKNKDKSNKRFSIN